MCVGLLLLPVSRNSVWSQLCGISCEALVKYHILLGYLVLFLVAIHILLWWRVYSQQGSFPKDVFSVPQTYHPVRRAPSPPHPAHILSALFYVALLLIGNCDVSFFT